MMRNYEHEDLTVHPDRKSCKRFLLYVSQKRDFRIEWTQKTPSLISYVETSLKPFLCATCHS